MSPVLKKVFPVFLAGILLMACFEKKAEPGEQENPVPGKGEVAILFAPAVHATLVLGQSEKIGGVAHGSLRDRFIRQHFDRLTRLPSLKKGGIIAYEEIALLSPSLIIGSREDGANVVLRQFLKKSGIGFLEYRADEGLPALKPVAEALGAMERFESIRRFFAQIQSDLKQKEPDIESCYFSVLELDRTLAGRERGWLQDAGFNVVPDPGKGRLASGKFFINREWLYRENPQWIFALEPSVVGSLMKEPQFAALEAVGQKRVILMPIGLTRWGHPNSLEKPLASLFAAHHRNRDQVTRKLLEERTGYFYSEFLEIELSPVELTELLEGKWIRKPKRVR